MRHWRAALLGAALGLLLGNGVPALGCWLIYGDPWPWRDTIRAIRQYRADKP